MLNKNHFAPSKNMKYQALKTVLWRKIILSFLQTIFIFVLHFENYRNVNISLKYYLYDHRYQKMSIACKNATLFEIRHPAHRKKKLL